jgi:hypothetical protein
MMGGMPPQMMPNPAYMQWQQMEQQWQAETQRRQQQFAKACDLIKGDASKRYKIDIEADSTVAADEKAEQASRTEFLTAITPFLGTVIPMAVQTPAIAPLAKEMIMFAVRGFRVSRQLEDAFESALDNLGKQPPPQPEQKGGGNTKSPMEIQAEAQTAAGEQQTDVQVAAAKSQTDQQKIAADLMKSQAQNQLQMHKIDTESQLKAAELQLKARELEGREALEQARLTRITARNAEGLV